MFSLPRLRSSKLTTGCGPLSKENGLVSIAQRPTAEQPHSQRPRYDCCQRHLRILCEFQGQSTEAMQGQSTEENAGENSGDRPYAHLLHGHTLVGTSLGGVLDARAAVLEGFDREGV